MNRYRAMFKQGARTSIILLSTLLVVLLFPLELQAQTAAAGDAPVIRLEGKEIGVGEEAMLKLILASAPRGLQKYDITVSIRDSSITRICCARGVAIGGLFFQVVGQTDSSIELRALDLFGTEVVPGARDVTLAEIKVVGLKGGQSGIDVKVNLFIDDEAAVWPPGWSRACWRWLLQLRSYPPSGTQPTLLRTWTATASMRISTGMGSSRRRMSPYSPSTSTARSFKHI